MTDRMVVRCIVEHKVTDIGSLSLGQVPFSISLFGNPSSIARALGLDIELPDPNQIVDLDYDWKRKLIGKVADQDLLSGKNADWALLIKTEFCEVTFDFAEGISFQGTFDKFDQTLDLVCSLASKGISLWEDGQCLVRISQTLGGKNVPALDPMFEAAGLVGAPRRFIEKYGHAVWHELPHGFG